MEEAMQRLDKKNAGKAELAEATIFAPT